MSPDASLPVLDAARAARFAAIALDNLTHEYPHKLDHVLASDADAVPPRALHPAFHASYDWHSCVHMHWLLVHVWRRFPSLSQRTAIAAVLDAHFAPGAIAAECDYLERPDARSFERTYGWAWLLELAAELERGGEACARWSSALGPLADAFVRRYLDFLPRADYPIRYGMHPNSAFGLALALDYALATGNDPLGDACRAKALAWFGADADAPVAWEPAGADFLSPALIEAELMRRVLDPAAFSGWLARFLPGIGPAAPSTLLTPARVSDRSDAQIVHLDGLNLARAWCWRGVAGSLSADDARRGVALVAARRHLDAGLEGLDSGEFVGAHWLASFAALALGALDASAANA
jgi:hypothetical protein